jgi:hypothetical protein
MWRVVRGSTAPGRWEMAARPAALVVLDEQLVARLIYVLDQVIDDWGPGYWSRDLRAVREQLAGDLRVAQERWREEVGNGG